MSDAPDPGQQQAADLAARLLEAHRRVRALPPGDRAPATRRLLALSDASKHDVGRASARLDALLADLDAAGPPSSPEPGPAAPR